MIFECPNCRHEHEVPEAELTGEAMVLECGACRTRFRVVPEDTAEEVEPLPPPPDERTAVGTTLPEALSAAEGGVIPSSADFEESDSRTLGGGDTEQHTVPIDTADPALRRARPADPDTQNAPRPPSALDLAGSDTDAEGERVETVLQGRDAGRADRPARRLEPGPALPADSGLRATATPSKSNPDVYARIAQAESVSVVPVRPPERPRPATKAWNEPSVVQVSSTAFEGPRAVLHRLGAQLERAPLFLKVWLLVFPIALGVILLLSRRSPEEATPIAIPAHTIGESQRPRVVGGAPPEASEPPGSGVEPAGPSSPDASVVERAVEPTERPTAETKLPATVFDDSPAPEGMSFVRGEGVRIKSSPGAKGKPVGSLVAGSLVRVYDEVDDWALVLVPPRGPAGFVKRDQLDARKPLAVLARDLAFLGCTPSGGSVTACLDDADRQAQACLEGCGANERCERACRLAGESCAESCKRR